MPGLTFDQLRVRPMDVLMGRTRYDKIRYAMIGFGGAFLALVMVLLAMIGALSLFARSQGAQFEWGIIVPNRVAYCRGIDPAPAPTPVAEAAAYHLPSPTGEGLGASLYMSSERGRDGVGTPSLPDVGHPAAGASVSSQISAGAVALAVSATAAVVIAVVLRGLLATLRYAVWALIAGWCFLFGAGLRDRLGR